MDGSHRREIITAHGRNDGRSYLHGASSAAKCMTGKGPASRAAVDMTWHIKRAVDCVGCLFVMHFCFDERVRLR